MGYETKEVCKCDKRFVMFVVQLHLNHTALDYIRKYSILDEANNEYVSYRLVFGYIEYSNVRYTALILSHKQFRSYLTPVQQIN